MGMVRPGIMIYGFYPDRETPRSIPLEPGMSVCTRVSFLKRVPAGTRVGANCLRAVTTSHMESPQRPLSCRRRATSATACWHCVMAYWGGRRLYGAFARHWPDAMLQGRGVRGRGPLESGRKVPAENRMPAECGFGNP